MSRLVVSEMPACPNCGTDLHVGRDKADEIDYRCHLCGRRWSR